LVENGGNLLILVPDSEDITKKVDLAQEAFDKYFYNVSFMETSMNLASLKISETDLSYPGWRDTYDRLQIELMKRKQTKFANILTTDQHPHVIPKTLYDPKPEFYRSADEYGERSPLCRNCGKHHKDEVPGDEDDPQNCNYCNEDKRLGSIIVKDCNYIEFGEKGRFEDKDSTNQERKDFTIDLGDFSFDFRVAIVPEKDAGISSIRLLGKFSESVEGRFTTLSNWVPYFNEDKFGKYVPTDYVLEPGEVEPKLDGLITFDLLMSYRPGGGVDYMGVLKADVDNLGKFLMDDKGCFKDGSAAKYFGFSRYLDLFFSGWLRGKLAEGDAKSACIPFDASDIYTIFAGGDDLALVGRWDDLLVLANLIYTKFKNYVCDNKELTMSFGYVAVAPKYPISEAIHGAEEKLKEAKNFVHDKSNANHEPEKDSIKAFDCIFKNGLLVELLPDGNLLATAKRDESDRDDNRVMNPAMLHRFLGYQESAVKSQKYNSNKMSEIEKSEFHPNHLIYRARVSYELERNLRKGKDESKLVADSELKRVNDLLKNVYFEDKGTKHFKFPLTWAAYRNR
jgi:CRISPR-associated protein Csm1